MCRECKSIETASLALDGLHRITGVGPALQTAREGTHQRESLIDQYASHTGR